MSLALRLKAVPTNSVIGMAIAGGVEKDLPGTIRMIKDQIVDNKGLMTEVLGEELVNEIISEEGFLS